MALLSYLGFGGAGASAATSSAAKGNTTDAVRALPAEWYTSQEMYELERRAIFSRKWLLVTHKLRFKEAGDWIRYDVAGYDFVVARDRTGSINAFHNVCRHRAYPVVETPQGSAKIFACRYHGWSYGLNGKLAKAPGYQDLDGFDKSKNGLFPIHVHIDTNGFIWVNLDSKEKPDLAWEDDFDGIDKQERFKEFNFDNYEFDHFYEMEGGYNWKILADNFNECYHCKTTHPDVPTLANLEAYDVDTEGCSIKHKPGTPSPEQLKTGLRLCSTYYFPNSSMTVTPHFMMIQKFVPSGPTSSSMRYEVFRNKHSSEEDFQAINQMYKRIMAEDKVLCDRAQKNLNTGVFINGEMHPKMEKGPLFFQKCVRETVTEHHAREKAAGHEIWPARQNLPNTASVSQEDVEFCKGLACSTRKDSLVW